MTLQIVILRVIDPQRWDKSLRIELLKVIDLQGWNMTLRGKI